MADKHWYIVQAYSNFERKVADSIREQAKQRHLDHLFEEVVPGDPLADQPALHVDEADQHGIDRPGGDLLLEPVEVEIASHGPSTRSR